MSRVMADRGETSLGEPQCVLVVTNLDTNIGILVRNNETVFDIKEKICKEHQLCYPEIGEIIISALKIKRRGYFFRFSDYMPLSKAFDGFSSTWYVYVDAVRVEKNDPMTIVAVNQNCSAHELLEEKKTANESVLVDEHTKDMTSKEVLEIEPKKTAKKRKMNSLDGKGSRKKVYVDAVRVEKNEPVTIMAVDQNRSDPKLQETPIESALVDEHTKDMTFKQVLEIDVPKKTTKKRKMKSLDRKGSRKNPLVDLNQTAIATTASKYVVDENHDVFGKAQVEAVASESERKTSISMEENQKTPVVDRLLQEKNLTVDSDVHIRGEVNDVQANQNLEEARVTEVATKKSNGSNKSNKSCATVLTESLKQDLEKGEKTAELVKIDVEKNIAPTLELLDGHITATEGVNESREVCGEVRGCVAAEYCVILPKGKLDELLPGAIEKDNKRGEESRLAPNAADNLRIAELVTNPENELEAISGPTTEKKKKKRKKSTKDHGKTVDEIKGVPEKHLEANSGMTTGPATEKKKENRTMPSKDVVDQSTAATTTLNEIVNGSIDRVDATLESIPVLRGEMPADSLVDAIQNENEVREKVVDKVEESKTLDQIGKLTEKNKALEHDTVKDNDDESKSVKSTKKKTSKKAKIPGKEDISAAFGAQNVELVVGEEPDVVIRNVLGSLQDKNETQENLDKSEKKSRTKSKKKHASKTVESCGATDISLNVVKPKENSRVQPASSGTSQLKSKVKNDRSGSKVNHYDASVKGAVINEEDVKKTSNSPMVNKSKTNFFKDAENSSDDKSKPVSHVSTKASGSSSDDNSSMSRRQGNKTAGGTKRSSESLQDILRSSSSYKKAKLAASQSQDAFEDESPALDFVPDSQAN